LHRHRRPAGALGVLAFVAVLLTGLSAALAAPSPETAARTLAPDVPTWTLTSYRQIGYDRSFKADLIDELPEAPRLVVFGGSRATRFAPSFFLQRAGLPTFNCSLQNCRPTDAYAFSSYLFSRAPDVRLDCVFAIQTATFADDRLHPGLLYDERLSRAFPEELLTRQKALVGKPPLTDLLDVNRFTARGLLVRNSYDLRRKRPGYSFARVLDIYISRLLPKYTWRGPTRQTRARLYFEKTMQLFNQHGVTPAVVIMPYHPRALRAFRAVGFQKKMDALLAYLRDARTRCDFRVLNVLDIKSFDGRERWFYDGAHVTQDNARLILALALRTWPVCFL
jgi:hypothetical protein